MGDWSRTWAGSWMPLPACTRTQHHACPFSPHPLKSQESGEGGQPRHPCPSPQDPAYKQGPAPCSRPSVWKPTSKDTGLGVAILLGLGTAGLVSDSAFCASRPSSGPSLPVRPSSSQAPLLTDALLGAGGVRAAEPEGRDTTVVTTSKAETSEEGLGKAGFSRPAPCPTSFLEMMEARSRGHASPLAANGQSPSSGSQSPVVPPSTVSTGSSSPSTPQPAPQPPLNAPSACPSPPSPLEAPLPPAPPVAPAPPPRRSIISRLFGTSPAAEAAPSPPGRPQEQPLRRWVWVAKWWGSAVSLAL